MHRPNIAVPSSTFNEKAGVTFTANCLSCVDAREQTHRKKEEEEDEEEEYFKAERFGTKDEDRKNQEISPHRP